MEITEQERKLEKSTAKAFGSLSIGLFATAVLVNSVSGGSGWIALLVVGIVFASFSFYLACIHKWKRKKVLEIAANVRIEHVAWFLGLTGLGIGLVRTEVNNLAIPGLVCIIAGCTVLIIGTVMNFKQGPRLRKLRC